MRLDTATIAAAALNEAGHPAQAGRARRPMNGGGWSIKTRRSDGVPCAMRWKARELGFAATGEEDTLFEHDYDRWHAAMLAVNGGCHCKVDDDDAI
jgi:hypothetical protein